VRKGPYSENKNGRPTCYSCFRPLSHCLCSLIDPFNAHCDIIILQHPHERKKYYGTAKIAAKAIKNARILRGITFEENEITGAFQGKTPYLLYPGENAEDCGKILLDSNNTVIVIDGTWDEAGKIVHRNPLLKNLPRLSFKNEFRSNYKIRKQPKDYCLSTIESIAHMLSLNAAGCGQESKIKNYQKLFYYFSSMVDRQLSYLPRGASVS
jgi:DTW domain-containing protein YfiP